MPVIALILIAELYIEQLLLFREWIVEGVGKVVALWLAVAGGEALSQLWLFIVAPFFGAALSAMVWKGLMGDNKE